MKSATANEPTHFLLPVMNAPRNARTLRIGFVTPRISSVGGAEIWIRALSRSFRSCQTIGVYSQEPIGPQENFNDAENRDYGGGSTRLRFDDVAEVGSGDEYFEELYYESDILVAWGVKSLPDVVRERSTPIVNVMHGTAELKYSTDIAKESVLWSNFNVGVAAECIDALPPACQTNAVVIPNGSEIERIAPRFGREEFRSNWSANGIFELNPSDKVLLFMGRLSDEKNQMKAIYSLQYLPPNYKLIMAGSSQNSTSISKEMAKLYPGRVGFAEYIPDVGDLLAMADCLVAPSDTEAHPLSINEAWLAGLPVVTHAYPTAISMQKRHGPMSLLSPIDSSPESFAKQITRAVADGREGKIPRHAKEIAWMYYTGKAMARRWESFLHLAHYSFHVSQETPELTHIIPMIPKHKPQAFRQTGQA